MIDKIAERGIANMLKRIIAIFMMTVFIPISIRAAGPIDVVEDEKNYESIAIVSSLGIMDLSDDGTFRAENFITRAEMAKIAATVYNIDNTAYENIDSPYSDVAKDNPYMSYIAACKDYKLMVGHAGDIFEPNGYVTMDQFNSVIIRLLGYEALATQLGKYPDGYDKVAQLLGIKKYLQQSGEYLSRSEAAAYLYKALDTPVAQIAEGKGQNIMYTTGGDTTLSEQYMELTRIEGIVTANEISCLPGNSSVAKGNIAIEGVVAGVGDTDIKNHLGKYVIAYAKIRSDGEPEYIKTYIEPLKYNTEIKVQAKDLVKENTNSNQISVQNQNREKIYKLAKDCIVIRNGEVLNSYSDDVFNIDIGTIHIINTLNKGDYDLVIIDEPLSLIFKQYNESSGTMYFHYRTESLRVPDDALVEVYIDGEQAALSDLSEWMSVFLYKTDSDKMYRFEAASKTVTGIYTSGEFGNDQIGVNSVIYDISADFESYSKQYKTLVLGTEYTFIFNPFDEIVAIIDAVGKSEKYGFVCSAYTDDLGEEFYLRLYTEDNEQKDYKIYKNVSLERGPNINKMKAEDIFSPLLGIVDENKKAINQLIKYRLNADGEINCIYLAFDNTDNISCQEDYFTLDFKKMDNSSIYYNNSSFGGLFQANPNSLKIFNVPAEIVEGSPKVTDISEIYIENDMSIRSTNLYNIYLYDADKYRTVGVMVRYIVESKLSSDLVGRWETAVVNKIYESVLSNGELGYMLEYYEGGTLYKKEAPEGLKTISCINTNWGDMENTRISQLKTGDVIQVLLAKDPNTIQYIHLLGKADNMSEDHERIASSGVTTPTNIVSTRIQTIPGTVIDVNDETILVSSIAGNGAECERSVTKTATASYYLYDTKRNKVEAVTSDDVSPGDRVFIRLNAWACRLVLIIR